MRAFLAIEIEEHVKNNIKRTQDILRESQTSKIKYVETENIHLTLKFFGDINTKKQEEIDNIITESIKSYEEYILKIVNMGTFPKSNNPRVIWVGIKDKTGNTVNIIKELDNKFSEIGFKKEKSYQPHITIGRVKHITNREKLSDLLKEKRREYYGKMTVKSIKLKSSTLTPDGPIYETIKEYPLTKVNP